jgi:rfaE bifunctional protein nucleotidyltransferase chain/domain
MPLHHPNIVIDWEALNARLAAWRDRGKRIVFTNGCYDILHPGHVDLLARARELGDALVLGLNSDESVRRLGKGEDRPFNAFAARAFVAAHLASVDLVTCFEQDTPLRLIEHIRPDVLVKGGDWPVGDIVGGAFVAARGGSVRSLPFMDGYGTTLLVERIRQG